MGGRAPVSRALAAFAAAALLLAAAWGACAPATNVATIRTTPSTNLPPTPPPRSALPAIRVDLVGYRPGDRKVAVVCAGGALEDDSFVVRDAAGTVVLRPTPEPAGAFGPCSATYRVDVSALREEGTYRIEGGGATSPPVHVGADVWAGAADSLLVFLRIQRSGWNPFFRDSVHTHDGILVDAPDSGAFVPVSGGWADAADYLQYVTTSGTATFQLLQAWRDHPGAFGDAYDARGVPGANGVPDVLDEARHGLEWLLAMFPGDSLILNQLGDDRDHAYFDLPPTDSSDYGWGKGGPRPVYPCTGHPQGLFRYRNRSDGVASTAGKMAAAFALGARVFASRDGGLARRLGRAAGAAYALGRKDPGVCQTAPARAPYFYEETNWVDDMELAAAELAGSPPHGEAGRDRDLVGQALRYARSEPVTPWMGRDTARHYAWYPWHNNGHYELWRVLGGESRGAGTGDVAADSARAELAAYYREGLARVAARADNGFRVGVPFIWCSNDLMASLATQAILYRRMTGDTTFVELESAARDWLFGANPWGQSMVIGLPAGGPFPRDPHSVIAAQLGARLTGALVDGPVYRSIFESLAYVGLRNPDEFAGLNDGFIVYHDDLGDYATNEPITDGTANLAYLLSSLSPGTPQRSSVPSPQ